MEFRPERHPAHSPGNLNKHFLWDRSRRSRDPSQADLSCTQICARGTAVAPHQRMHQHLAKGDGIEHQLQVMDVYIVDVLSHIEAVLRNAHSMQRVLLKLRSEAPPPSRSTLPAAIAALRGHATELDRECGLLRQIVQDMQAGVDALESAEHPRQAPRSGSQSG